ncbi:hypothetical protein GH733_010996 [Mirounga leonina]|nr:hypothetical protein GH733_010996 [Mirounga leonina]
MLQRTEYIAEITFEPFKTPGLYIAMQAALAVTGVVPDSEDGVTPVLPAVEGHVVGSWGKRTPITGRATTYFIQQLLRGCEVGIPPEQSLETAMEVKKCCSYVCPDLGKEFNKYDTGEPSGLNSLLESRQSQRKNFPLTLVMTDPWDLRSFSSRIC